jgi:hypothetical protein
MRRAGVRAPVADEAVVEVEAAAPSATPTPRRRQRGRGRRSAAAGADGDADGEAPSAAVASATPAPPPPPPALPTPVGPVPPYPYMTPGKNRVWNQERLPEGFTPPRLEDLEKMPKRAGRPPAAITALRRQLQASQATAAAAAATQDGDTAEEAGSAPPAASVPAPSQDRPQRRASVRRQSEGFVVRRRPRSKFSQEEVVRPAVGVASCLVC